MITQAIEKVPIPPVVTDSTRKTVRNFIYRRLQVRSISESVPSEERGELRDALHFLHLLGQAAETEARSYKRVYLLRRGA